MRTDWGTHSGVLRGTPWGCSLSPNGAVGGPKGSMAGCQAATPSGVHDWGMLLCCQATGVVVHVSCVAYMIMSARHTSPCTPPLSRPSSSSSSQRGSGVSGDLSHLTGPISQGPGCLHHVCAGQQWPVVMANGAPPETAVSDIDQRE